MRKFKVKILKPCEDKDNKRKLEPGMILNNLSAFERGRLLAEGSAEIIVEPQVERSVKKLPAKRRGRPRKSSAIN